MKYSNKNSWQQSPNRVGYLDTLRLIATIAVILLHTSSGCFNVCQDMGCDVLANDFYRHACSLGVPVFVMISGSLFLNPRKDTSYSILFMKYVKRIFFALLVFGFPMCILEIVMTGGSLLDAVPNFLTGHSWSHMWYLYMLIGLYLLTPIIKPMICHASVGTINTALIVLFIMSSLLPTINNYNVEIEGWMKLPPYIFMYILGYYLTHLETWRINRWHCLVALILYLAIVSMKEIVGLQFATEHTSYSELNTIFGATALFLLAKRLNLNWKNAKKTTPYLFAVYLVHPIFLNIAYKKLYIYPNTIGSPWITCLLFTVAAFVLSLLTGYLLKRLPPFNKHIL